MNLRKGPQNSLFLLFNHHALGDEPSHSGDHKCSSSEPAGTLAPSGCTGPALPTLSEGGHPKTFSGFP